MDLRQQRPGGCRSSAVGRGSQEAHERRLRIELFGNGQIGNEIDLIGQVASGSLDMAMVGTGALATIEPSFAVVDLPFVWKSKESYWKTVNGLSVKVSRTSSRLRASRSLPGAVGES